MKLFPAAPSDADIVAGIAIGSKQKRQYENTLYYRFYHLIKEGVFKHRLDEDESSIAYSDTIFSVIENIEKGRFEGRSSLKSYTYQIFSNKCVDLIRKKTTNREQVNHRGSTLDDYLNLLQDDTLNVIERLMEKYDLDLLNHCIDLLGEKCRQMVLSWSEGIADRQIAAELGYQSIDVAKTSRLRCLEKLRVTFRQQHRNSNR